MPNRAEWTQEELVALAAAFCSVTSAGSADLDGRDHLVRAQRLQQMSADLAACARLWRAGTLH